MYVYFFEQRYGDDKIVHVTGEGFRVGELRELNGAYAIVLGDTITNPELIKSRAAITESRLVIKKFFSAATIDRIHQLVATRFCPYSSVIPLFTGPDITQLVKKQPKKSTPLARNFSLTVDATRLILKGNKEAETTSQQLLVFPDLRTMAQMTPPALLTQPGVAQRHSGLTVVQQAKLFRAVKTGQIHTLLTTHAGIFQDWHELAQITIIDTHKRRYKSQQDPRYRTPTVLEMLAEQRNAKIVKTGYVSK